MGSELKWLPLGWGWGALSDGSRPAPREVFIVEAVKRGGVEIGGGGEHIALCFMCVLFLDPSPSLMQFS